MFTKSIVEFDGNNQELTYTPLGYDRPTGNHCTGVNGSDGYRQPLTYTPLAYNHKQKNKDKYDAWGCIIISNDWDATESDSVPNDREVTEDKYDAWGCIIISNDWDM